MEKKVQKFMDAHHAISALPAPADARAEMHALVGRAAEDYFKHNDHFAYGWGKMENALSFLGRIEDSRYVYGFFRTTDIVHSPLVLLRLWQSQIPDSETEYIAKDKFDNYYYVRASMRRYYSLSGRIVAHKQDWIVVDPRHSPREVDIVAGAEDDVLSLPEFGEINFAEFPPEHYLRPYWHPGFGQEETEFEYPWQFRSMETRIDEALKRGAKITGVRVEPRYVWEGRVYLREPLPAVETEDPYVAD